MSVQEIMHGDAPGWWVLYTRHQHEKSVAGMLTVKGANVFLPLYESLRRWKDRRVRLLLPLFPGYAFVRSNCASRLLLVSTPGVNMIVTSGELAVVPENEISAIRRAVAEPHGMEPHPFLQCGQRVRVRSGPLEGLEGILTRRKSTFRLVLSVEMLAQAASVEVSECDIEPLKRSPQRYPATVLSGSEPQQQWPRLVS